MKYKLFAILLSFSASCWAQKMDHVSSPIVQEHRVSDVVTITVKGVSFDMVRVEGGTFSMGATAEQGEDVQDDERPTPQVTLSTYYIGKYEVTQRLWKAVMGTYTSEFLGDDYPVGQVSWEDGRRFIAQLSRLTGKRFALPSEAQWEFAARGGNKSRGYRYSGSSNLDDVAWYEDNCGQGVHKVGMKQANELGLYDMSGNVIEWCQDWKGNYSSSSQTDPQGPNTGDFRIMRGGCYLSGVIDCRVAVRFRDVPNQSYPEYGLRLVGLF